MLFCIVFTIFFTGAFWGPASANNGRGNTTNNDVAFIQYKTTMQKGQKETFTAQVNPANENSLQWSVSDPTILHLSNAKGGSVEITALKEGQAMVTVYHGNGSNQGNGNKSAQIMVTVVPADEESEAGINGIIDPKEQVIEKPQNGTAIGAVTIQLTPYGKLVASELVREPVDVVFVIDKSGSMVQQENKLGKAKEAASNAVDILLADNTNGKNIGDRIGLIEFSTDAKKLNDLTANKNNGFQAIKNKINGITAYGWTNYWDALNTANTMFTTSSNRKYIIFLTDGVPTHGKGTSGGTSESQIQKALKDAEEAATQLAKSSIKLYSIGFGKDVRMNNLERLSSLTGASAYQGTMENLNSLFAQITQEIKRLSLGEVKVKVKLPSSDVQLAPDTEAIVDNGYAVISFKDVPYTENGPVIDTNELQKALKLQFLKEGTYSFTDISLSYKKIDGTVAAKQLNPFTIQVVSQMIPVEGIVLSAKQLNMDVDPNPNTVPETKWEETLTAEVTPKDATNKTIKLHSTDENIVEIVKTEVDEATGKVTATLKAKGVGIAYIEAETEDGKHKEQCKVHVKLTPVFDVKRVVIEDNAYVIVKPEKGTILPETRWYVKIGNSTWQKFNKGDFDEKQMVIVLDKVGNKPVLTDFGIWAVTLDKTVANDSNPDPSAIPADQRHGEKKKQESLNPDGNKITDYLQPMNPAQVMDSPGDNRAASVKSGYTVRKVPDLVDLEITDARMVLKDKNNNEIVVPLQKGLLKDSDVSTVPRTKTKVLKSPGGKTVTYAVRVELTVEFRSKSGGFDAEHIAEAHKKDPNVNVELKIDESVGSVTVKGKGNLQ
jgi:Mg-chelatase subunit ChlD